MADNGLPSGFGSRLLEPAASIRPLDQQCSRQEAEARKRRRPHLEPDSGLADEPLAADEACEHQLDDLA